MIRMRKNMFTYVGPVSGLMPALEAFTKEEKEVVDVDKKSLMELLKYFILTNSDMRFVTVDEVQKCLAMIGCTDIPDEYIISVLDGRC